MATTVNRLERAVATRNFATVCDQLFTAQARKRSGGDECERQLASATEAVKRPRIQIKAIDVKNNTATVRVRTTAEGQPALTDQLQLRRQGGRWLVEALG